MRKMTSAIACLLMGIASRSSPVNGAEMPWNVTKSDHFIVYSHGASSDYVEGLIGHAEAYYHQLTEQLGFTRFEGFWTWDKRAKMYLYDDRTEYQRMAKQPGWSEAGANVHQREIHTYVGMAGFFEAVLPHELGHIIFREFIGEERRLPLWLDEGIACFLEQSKKPARLTAAKAIVHTAHFLPLEALTRVDRAQLTDPEVFYAEAASVIEFLFRQYGREPFVEYCRGLRAAGGWEELLKTVYGFRDLADMNERWVEFLKDDGLRS